MSLNDFKKVSLSYFNGIFDRGDPNTVPFDHFSDALNLKFTNSGCLTRSGVSKSLSLTHAVKRFYLFKYKTPTGGQPQQTIITMDGSGNLYDGTTKIFDRGSFNIFDMFGVDIYNKVFLCMSGNNTGWNPQGSSGFTLVGPSVLIYDANWKKSSGILSVRGIGAIPPRSSEGTLAAADGATATPSLTAGLHYFAVAYETISGYITHPGPLNNSGSLLSVAYTAPGGKKCTLSGIPIRTPSSGNGNIVSRRFILATPANLTEYFFVPDDKITPAITDDSTTSVTLSFQDSDLISSADYLFNMRIQQPCAVGGVFYKGRLILWSGRYDVADQFYASNFPDAQQSGSTLLVSMNGQPEAFDGTTGFVLVSPDDGYYITTCFVVRDTLYVCKNKGVYAVQDNGQEPAFWDVNPVDTYASISVPPFGVASYIQAE